MGNWISTTGALDPVISSSGTRIAGGEEDEAAVVLLVRAVSGEIFCPATAPALAAACRIKLRRETPRAALPGSLCMREAPYTTEPRTDRRKPAEKRPRLDRG
jgi:hypothetical protein